MDVGVLAYGSLRTDPGGAAHRRARTSCAHAFAEAALDSVGRGEAYKDGIAYLADLIELGVITPLTFYRDEILRLSGARTLNEARTRGAR